MRCNAADPEELVVTDVTTKGMEGAVGRAKAMQEAVSKAKSTTQKMFVHAYADWYFLVLIPRKKDDDEWSFATKVSDSGRLDSLLHGAAEDELLPGQVLVEVAKKPNNPFSGWISVGRAGNNDVVLKHASVSKIHARIYQEDGPKFFVQDAGSANGTMVRGIRVTGDRHMAIRVGDTVRFGELSCEFFDGAGLYDRLRRIP
ncbi:MAG: FHA domain-containing protein [Deltaproteobacteria bacterium]|nr:FHA domain-containing protein [Deltaproteobacteria bacterium]